MTSPFSDELVRAVAKALCDHYNKDVSPENRCHWSAYVEEAKVALLARKQFKRDRRATLDKASARGECGGSMTDAERELMEMMMAALVTLRGGVIFHPRALENLLAAIERYQHERDAQKT